MPLFYNLPDNLILTISDEAVEYINYHIQINLKTEIGGQLFCNFHEHGITIQKATVSEAENKSKHRFKSKLSSDQEQIYEMFSHGFHYIGDWHSHFEDNPSPSITDINTFKSIYSKSTKNLNYMIFSIISANIPDKWWIGLINDITTVSLSPPIQRSFDLDHCHK